MTTLNKKIKEKLAFDLTAKAAEKKLKALSVKLKALNEEFWTEYKTQIDSVLQIDPKRYDAMIQLGAMRYITSFEMRGLGNSKRGFDQFFKSIANQLPTRIVCLVSYSRYGVHFRSDQSLPMVNDDALTINAKFAKRADTLLGEYIDIVIAATKFHDDVTSILQPIRTRKVLLDRFPEASKLLPAPAEKSGDLVPVQLINDVRDRLKAGIPS